MRTVSLITSALAVCTAVLVLVGWAMNIAILKSILPSLVAMKPNTAMGLGLSGIGSGLMAWKEPGKGLRATIAVIAAILMTLGAATLAEYAFNWNPGVDQLLFHEAPNTVWTAQPGRMAPVSAFCFVLMGAALLAGSQRVPRWLGAPVASGLGAALTVVGALALVGGVAGGWLGAPTWNDSGLAVHTAATFMLLGVGLLAFAIEKLELRWRLGVLATAGFVLGIAIMLMATAVGFNFMRQMLDTSVQVGQTQELLRALEKARGEMGRLESDQRGYVLTGDASLLAMRDKSEAEVLDDLGKLGAMPVGDQEQQHRIEQLKSANRQRFAFEDETIATRKQQGLAAAEQMMASSAGMRLSEAIRELFGEVQNAGFAVLDDQQQKFRAASTSTFLVLPVGVFLSLSILTVGLFFMNAGVGERVRMEMAWKQSEERFQKVIENLTEGLVIAGMDGQLLHWNPAALAMHGFATSAEWALRLPEFFQIFELSTLEGRVLALEEWPMSRVLHGEALRDVTVRLRRKDEDWERIYSYGGRVVQEPSGERLGFLSISDITERSRSEQALRASEIQLRSFVEQAPVSMAMLDRKMVYVAASREWVKEFGNGYESLTGLSHYELHPDVPEEWKEVHRQALGGTSQRNDEDLWVHADGSKQWLRWTVQPWQDAQGAVGGVMILTEDITDRKQADEMRLENVRLEEENRQFANASRMKSEFLANMSHELRTPLNGIIGFTELLVDQKPGPLNARQQDYLASVLSSAGHLLQLINDVLDLAKVEAGKMSFEPASFNPEKAIKEVCAVVHGLANTKGVRLRSETAEGVGAVTLDEHRFKQICYNLLSNAVKFTDGGGSVEIVATEVEGGNFAVRVTDTGIGIKEEEMKLLFREFQQLDSGASRRYEGTGLGLALTKKMVEMQGGSIRVESEHGKGSTFTVVLPKVAG